MKIKHGMILAAGLGKRMQPLTLKTPKPLVKVGKQTLLEKSINLLIKHGVDEIVINVHYLADQIKNFINTQKFNANIIVSDEKNMLLDTGGGVLQGTKVFKEKPFFVVNPDTLWGDRYLNELGDLEKIYFKSQKVCLLVVNKELSFDDSFKGDFNLKGDLITKNTHNQYIYTGLQILNRNIFQLNTKKIFSMNEIWSHLIKKKELAGLISKQKFYHINTKEMYKKILDKKIID